MRAANQIIATMVHASLAARILLAQRIVIAALRVLKSGNATLVNAVALKLVRLVSIQPVVRAGLAIQSDCIYTDF